MLTVKVSDTETINNPHNVDAKRIFNENLAQVVHINLLPGEKLKKHTVPINVLFYVLEGTGIVEIGDEKKEVTKDTLIESPANHAHCWYNESSENLRVLVVKFPKQ